MNDNDSVAIAFDPDSNTQPNFPTFGINAFELVAVPETAASVMLFGMVGRAGAVVLRHRRG